MRCGYCRVQHRECCGGFTDRWLGDVQQAHCSGCVRSLYALPSPRTISSVRFVVVLKRPETRRGYREFGGASSDAALDAGPGSAFVLGRKTTSARRNQFVSAMAGWRMRRGSQLRSPASTGVQEWLAWGCSRPSGDVACALYLGRLGAGSIPKFCRTFGVEETTVFAWF